MEVPSTARATQTKKGVGVPIFRALCLFATRLPRACVPIAYEGMSMFASALNTDEQMASRNRTGFRDERAVHRVVAEGTVSRIDKFSFNL